MLRAQRARAKSYNGRSFQTPIQTGLFSHSVGRKERRRSRASYPDEKWGGGERDIGSKKRKD